MAKSQDRPLVSIIILNWNGLEDTLECLAAVRKLSYQNTEVVVVDNGSNDDSKATLAKEKGIIFVDNSMNRGFTGGHIDGLKKSNGDYILLLNNDALIAKDYIEKALELFDDPSVAVVGGRSYLWDDNNPKYKTTNKYYAYQDINPTTGEAIFTQRDKGLAQEVNTVSGSCVIVRKTTIDEVGYLYEPFFAYFEETDLFARIKRAGYKIMYSPDLHIWHQGGKSSTSYFQYHQLLKNRYIFALRNFQTSYLARFLLNYCRIGLKSLLLQFRKNDMQIMRKAYSKAFLLSIFITPAHLWGRFRLWLKHGASRYNEQIQREQRGISFIIDLSDANHGDTIIDSWVTAISHFPLSEVVFVISDVRTGKIFQKKITEVPFAKIVIDQKNFKTHSLNLGWLSSKHDWLYFSDSKGVPSIQELEMSLAQTVKKKASLTIFTNEDEEMSETLLIKRDLLIRSGGFLSELSIGDSKLYLKIYAMKDRLRVYNVRLDSLGIKSTFLSTEGNATVPRLAKTNLEIDRDALRQPNLWDRFIMRHGRLGQILTILRWLSSSKITLRLKLARTKNLILFSIALNRSHLATELKHIHNEYLKAHKPDSVQRLRANNVKKHLRHYSSDWSNVPVFIICRDRLSTLAQLLVRLESFGLKNICLIDNNSAFPPLLNFYDKTSYQVFSTGSNIGHKSPWESGFIKTLAPEDFYIVTDPDIIPTEECPDDVIGYFFKLHKEYPFHQKIGFGLRIDDLPNHYSHKEAVITWENQFWRNTLAPEVYEAPLDTTFALYKPFNYTYFLHPSIRTGLPYVARHLPWYVDDAEEDAEELYYRQRARGDVTSWTVEILNDTLQKELAKQPDQ